MPHRNALWRTIGSLLLVMCVFTRNGYCWDTFSDTWVATDGLGRSLPTNEQVGSPRARKSVAMFYFLWLGQHGHEGPFDISQILKENPASIRNPNSPPWGPLFAMHHWGESWFGYYVSDDEAVLAKHAQMLTDAGVDVVVFDATNQLTYPKSLHALCRTWSELRKHGNATPQIAFLCPFDDPRKVVCELYDTLYSPKAYPDLWYRWEGKPLILADPELVRRTNIIGNTSPVAVELLPGHTLGQSFQVDRPLESVAARVPTWTETNSVATLSLRRDGPHGERIVSRRFENIPDSQWLALRLEKPVSVGNYYLELSSPQRRVGWWGDAADTYPGGSALSDGAPSPGDRSLRVNTIDKDDERLLDFFTFRSPRPDMFAGPRGPGDWGWLEVYPQHAFYKTPGTAEEVTVGVAQNADGGKLNVFTNPHSRGRSFHNGREPEPAGQDFSGLNFAEQWQRALELDPSLIFITGWNEWVAGRFNRQSMRLADAGPVIFVDEFSREFSRDIEPMKGGHEDNYYYQTVSNIRRFKGVRPLPPVRTQPIQIDGNFADWANVEPEFRDDIGDPVHRDHAGWSPPSRYINQTGRNDIVAAKVAYDDTNVYFYVRTREPLSPSTDPNWMLLFLDCDRNSTNGWLGYDYLVDHNPMKPQKLVLEKHEAAGYHWDQPREITSRVAKNEMELAIPRAALGISTLPATIDFKWADNIQQTGEASDFTLNGDAAPNDRFNYRAVLSTK
jgi:hypothetical protein